MKKFKIISGLVLINKEDQKELEELKKQRPELKWANKILSISQQNKKDLP